MMVVAVLSVITFLVVLWSLWTRRHTWRYKWETASTVYVAFTAVAGLLIVRWLPVGQLLGTWLHSITHLWNLQYYIAHLCMLGGTSALVYNAVALLSTDAQIWPWFKTRVELPVAFGMVAMFGLFAQGQAARSPCRSDFLLSMRITEYWLASYWILFSSLIVYLLGHGVRAFYDLWYDKPSRGITSIYLMASVFGLLAAGARIITAIIWDLQTPFSATFTEVATFSSVALFCGGAGYSWMRRARWFAHGRRDRDGGEQHAGDGCETR